MEYMVFGQKTSKIRRFTSQRISFFLVVVSVKPASIERDRMKLTGFNAKKGIA